MPTTDKRVDAYIAKAPDFAKPILTRLRELAHEGAPDCEENIKWGMPTFTRGGILFVMGAFKKHCAVNFWKGRRVLGTPDGEGDVDWVARFRKLTSVSDLPPKKTMIGFVKKAVELSGDDTPAPKKRGKPKPELPTPDYMIAALKKNKKAQVAFEKFPPSHKREYVEWIVDAKTDATRDRRLAQALEWMAEGKARNWKYM